MQQIISFKMLVLRHHQQKCETALVYLLGGAIEILYCICNFWSLHLLIKAKKWNKIFEMALQSPFFNQGLSPNGNKLAEPLNYNFIPDLYRASRTIWNILWHKFRKKVGEVDGSINNSKCLILKNLPSLKITSFSVRWHLLKSLRRQF